MISPLAKPISNLRTTLKVEGKRLHKFPAALEWFGICVHTTGRGVPNKAKRLGFPIDQIGIDTYSKVYQTCPHYLIGSEGSIYGITDENLVAPHCGVKKWQRESMLDGTWIDHVANIVLEMWNIKWATRGFVSPQHLFPGKSGNKAYIGIELIPSLDRAIDGSLFSSKQYRALSLLVKDIAERNKIDLLVPNHLVGHEDLNPFDRWDSFGGWDPGALRGNPYFFWSRVDILSGLVTRP